MSGSARPPDIRWRSCVRRGRAGAHHSRDAGSARRAFAYLCSTGRDWASAGPAWLRIDHGCAGVRDGHGRRRPRAIQHLVAASVGGGHYDPRHDRSRIVSDRGGCPLRRTDRAKLKEPSSCYSPTCGDGRLVIEISLDLIVRPRAVSERRIDPGRVAISTDSREKWIRRRYPADVTITPNLPGQRHPERQGAKTGRRAGRQRGKGCKELLRELARSAA